ncbi:MAG: chromosomal replication initiator protein DnaA [Phycisphaeraceae bacterium]
MPRLDDKLWRDVMAYLRRHHAPICRQWFDELEPIALKSGLLRIRTTNSIQQNYLQKRCLEPFTEAAQSVTNALIAVRFDFGEDAKSEVDQEVTGMGLGGKSETNGALREGEEPAGERNGRAVPEALEIDLNDPVEPPTLSVRGDSRRLGEDGQPFDLQDDVVLNPDYTFGNFIVGPNNQMAYAASVAVANQPGDAYNPLFIHGGVGLGKTHLLQAICQTILTNKPDTRIVYVSCEAFMTQFIECVQRGQMLDFRHRYRYADMLVIDDIHFLANRERSQEEFFHTFNELYQARKQLVLSSDAAPSEIPHLEERLLSRFQWGLVTNVTKPHFETRVAILRAKAALRGLEIPDDVIAYLAGKIDSHARELEGAITSLMAYASLGNCDREINLALAAEALGEQINQPRSNHTTLQQIIDVITGYFSVKLSDLQSRRRHKSITEPRQLAMFLARKHTRFSLEEIGGHFGGRDHTTVMHSIKMVEERSGRDETFLKQLNLLEDRLQQSSGLGS